MVKSKNLKIRDKKPPIIIIIIIIIIQIQAVLRHQNSKTLHSVPKEAEKYLTEAGTTDDI